MTDYLLPYEKNIAIRCCSFCVFIQNSDTGIKHNKKLLLKHRLKHDLGWRNNCRALRTIQKGIWVPAVTRSCILITPERDMPKISMQELHNSQYFSSGHIRQKVPQFLFSLSDFMPTCTRKVVVWLFCPCDVLHQSPSSHKFIFKRASVHLCLPRKRSLVLFFSPPPCKINKHAAKKKLQHQSDFVSD